MVLERLNLRITDMLLYHRMVDDDIAMCINLLNGTVAHSREA